MNSCCLVLSIGRCIIGSGCFVFMVGGRVEEVVVVIWFMVIFCVGWGVWCVLWGRGLDFG